METVVGRGRRSATRRPRVGCCLSRGFNVTATGRDPERFSERLSVKGPPDGDLVRHALREVHGDDERVHEPSVAGARKVLPFWAAQQGVSSGRRGAGGRLSDGSEAVRASARRRPAGSVLGRHGESPGRQGRGKRHTPEERRAAGGVPEGKVDAEGVRPAVGREPCDARGGWVRTLTAEDPQGLELAARRPRLSVGAGYHVSAVTHGGRHRPATVPRLRAEENPALPRAQLGAAGEHGERAPNPARRRDCRRWRCRSSARGSLRLHGGSSGRVRATSGRPTSRTSTCRNRSRRCTRSSTVDRFSRYVVGHGLSTHQRGDIAVDVFREARALRQAQGGAHRPGAVHHAWRGKKEFQKLLAIARASRTWWRERTIPMTVGKSERFRGTIQKEFWWEGPAPRRLDEARARRQATS